MGLILGLASMVPGWAWTALVGLLGLLGLRGWLAVDRQRQRTAGLAQARREQQEMDDAAGHRARVAAARIAGADDSDLDRVLEQQAAERDRRVSGPGA